MPVVVLVVLALVTAGCGSLLPTPANAEAYMHKAAVLCLRIEVVGHGPRQGWPPEELAQNLSHAFEAYEEWRESGTAPNLDPEVSAAVDAFEGAWPTFQDDPFDVAFRCRQMVALLRSYFGVTSVPSMPVD